MTEHVELFADMNLQAVQAKDRGDFIASWASHTQEVGTGALHQVFPRLLFWRGMSEILSEACCCGEVTMAGKVLLVSSHIMFPPLYMAMIFVKFNIL